MNESVHIAAFYKFHGIADPADFQRRVVERIGGRCIYGIFLIASEGINATISGERAYIQELLDWVASEVGEFDVKHSTHHEHPFQKLRVRVRPSIIPLGEKQCDVEANTGVRVEPDEWNDLISRPGMMLIDTRNKYEVRAGTFEGAVDPRLRTFGDFPEYAEAALSADKDRPIAMFCTGGIRCEKASAYLRELGFKEVYQLHGGILRYLETVPRDQSKWSGECFVFDSRVTVDDELNAGTFTMCRACGSPLSPADLLNPLHVAGECCPHCAEKKRDDTEGAPFSI